MESVSPEKKLETTRQNHSLLILILAVLTCFISFFPVYIRSYHNEEEGWLKQTYVSYTKDPIIREASMASLFVVLCPAFNTLFEFVPLTQTSTSSLHDSDRQRKFLRNDTSLVILTYAEKFMFILSIICLSILSYYPTFSVIDRNSESIFESGGIFFNCSTTLQVSAILSFLAQQSKAFKWVSRCICILVSSSGVISSLALLYNVHGYYATMLFVAAAIVFDFAALIYTVTCTITLFYWIKQKYGKSQPGNKVGIIDAKSGEEEKAMQSNEEIAKEDFKSFIVGMHMFSTFVIMVLNACWVWYALSFSAFQLSIMIYISLAAAIVILVTENLAHRYVIVNALQGLLDAKKHYVRYISHEIRTPLSATLMGLRLLVNDYKNSSPSKGTVDYERLDTLQDVHSSCVAALDILNDLLCFNKLESGLLELHQESVGICGFIKESVAMFNVQARDCGVILRVIFEKPMSDENDENDDDNVSLAARSINRLRGSMEAAAANIRRGSVDSNVRRGPVPNNNRSVRSNSGQRRGGNSNNGLPDELDDDVFNNHDMISLDKFKMDQVIRNLVSNAIKFSPEGGVVTINAYFEPIPLVLKEKRYSVPNVGKKSEKNVRSTGSVVGGSVNLRKNFSSLFSPRLVSSDQGSVVPSPRSVEPVAKNGRLVVTVTDNGPGISAENQKRLFKEVIQFNPEKLQAGGGSGFGLFISKSIVDLHEGKISVYSAGEGKGTRFTLELPMSRTKQSSPTSQHDISRHSNQSNGRKVSIDNGPLMHTMTCSKNLTSKMPSVSQRQHNGVKQQGEVVHDVAASRTDENNEVRSVEYATINSAPISSGVTEDHKAMEESDINKRRLSASAALLACVNAPVPFRRASSLGRGNVLDPTPATTQRKNLDRKGAVMLRELSVRQKTSIINTSLKDLVVGVDPSQSPDVTNRKWHLLIVDDSPLNRKLLTKVMSANKHTCDEAKDGQEAVNAVQTRMMNKELKPYDAILMDFVMPVMDGPNATKIIRQLPFSGIIIGLTGNAMPTDITHFMDHGASAVLIKPIDMAEFDSTMKRLFQG